MKKVVLLGDSVRLFGYAPRLPALLGDGYTVYHPAHNGRFSSYTLQQIFEEYENIKDADVIHWNNGLWDVCNRFGNGLLVSREEYLRNLSMIADVLLKITPHVIFATTTPVTTYVGIDNADIEANNAAAVELLSARGIVINDLHSLLADDPARHISPDGIHPTDAAADLLAAQVAEYIRTCCPEGK